MAISTNKINSQSNDCTKYITDDNNMEFTTRKVSSIFMDDPRSDFPSPAVLGEESSISVSLIDGHLWRLFDTVSNEMIVTRDGRRMFPVIKVQIMGLEPNEMYKLLMDFKLVDSHRWKYLNGEWIKGSRADVAELSRTYTHPDSPNYGKFFMDNFVSFSRTKITNKDDGDSGKIFLNSMHKYIPRIHIYKICDDKKSSALVGTFSFPETIFIAVTAYQNDSVTNLKVKYNPFAKAFLEPRDSNDNACMNRDFNSRNYVSSIYNNGGGNTCSPYPDKYGKGNDPYKYDPNLHAFCVDPLNRENLLNPSSFIPINFNNQNPGIHDNNYQNIPQAGNGNWSSRAVYYPYVGYPPSYNYSNTVFNGRFPQQYYSQVPMPVFTDSYQASPQVVNKSNTVVPSAQTSVSATETQEQNDKKKGNKLSLKYLADLAVHHSSEIQKKTCEPTADNSNQAKLA